MLNGLLEFYMKMGKLSIKIWIKLYNIIKKEKERIIQMQSTDWGFYLSVASMESPYNT